MMKTSISFIGAGNVAWHLAPALDNSSFMVREVYSRKHKHAHELVERLYEAEVKDSLDFSDSESSIFIIAVKDDAIASIVKELVLPEGSIVVHTSGSQPLSVLEFAGTERTGVLYPLQTFTKGVKTDLQAVPVFIESDDKATEKILLSLAREVSKKVEKITSAQRRALHVAAVFASNFSTHMFTLASDLMRERSMNFDWLKPLIAETVNKSLHVGPEKAQTGPARRGDLRTLDKHMEYLKESEATAEIYKVISQNILDRYNG